MTMDLFAPKRVAPTLRHGDCLAVLRTLPDASVDSVVTDPPAGIAFMGKAWDEDKGGRRQWIAWMAEVMAEALRVLKPGGHALVWALPRTSHWTATALEDAGFDVRDCIVHCFGSGFPKSHNLDGAWTGWGTALKPASEHWWLVRKPLVGTVAANVERYGTGALNIDASRVVAAKGDEPLRWAQGRGMGFHGSVDNGPCEALTSEGRWPPNLLLSHTEDCTEGACADDCAVAEMDGQSGVTKSVRSAGRNGTNAPGSSYQLADRKEDLPRGHNDSGGASRFFPVFRYQAKPSRSEKGATNVHPTVKSIGLMDWLIRLVTPPGGVVLDPFLGSGTTGVAAAKGGFGFIGIEREDEYLVIARARIEAA